MDSKIQLKATGNTNQIPYETDAQIWVRLIRKLIIWSLIITAGIAVLKWYGIISFPWLWVFLPVLLVSPSWVMFIILKFLTINEKNE